MDLSSVALVVDLAGSLGDSIAHSPVEQSRIELLLVLLIVSSISISGWGILRRSVSTISTFCVIITIWVFGLRSLFYLLGLSRVVDTVVLGLSSEGGDVSDGTDLVLEVVELIQGTGIIVVVDGVGGGVAEDEDVSRG
jgi:hypothetical protein